MSQELKAPSLGNAALKSGPSSAYTVCGHHFNAIHAGQIDSENPL
jgi:hypothetical protein